MQEWALIHGMVTTGPKTVFFWAPLMKWCLVAAGVKDLSRPADKLSISQNVGAWKCHWLTVNSVEIVPE